MPLDLAADSRSAAHSWIEPWQSPLLRRNTLQDDFDVSFPQCTSAHVPHSSPSPAHQWSEEVLSVSQHPAPVQAALTAPPRCHASIQCLSWLGNHGRDLYSRSIYEGPFLHHIVNRYPQHSVLITSHRELLTQNAHTILQVADKSVMGGRVQTPYFSHSEHLVCDPLYRARSFFSRKEWKQQGQWSVWSQMKGVPTAPPCLPKHQEERDGLHKIKFLHKSRF